MDRARGRSGEALRRGVHRLERRGGLDAAADGLGRLGHALHARPRVRRLLRGEWLGHALHPLLTDFPLGTWMSASLLDIMGRGRFAEAAEHLLRFGVAAAVPTAAAGFAELPGADARARRVAVVHAAINGSALGLYALSLAARRRNRFGLGVALGIGGGLTATVGGYFGGHLSFVSGMGVDRGDPLTSDATAPA